MKWFKRLFSRKDKDPTDISAKIHMSDPDDITTNTPASASVIAGTHRDRHIRVFISSTFRDMQEERDILIKKIFPQLRKMCEERAVTWTEVDLRWGITTEQAAEGKVLPLCLEEIHRCRPYFIGLLGERYGWVPEPDSFPAELLVSQPWLKEHLQHSVTELEILHGVFNDDKMHGHAYFYFRDPSYLLSVPANRRSDFMTESAEVAGKLAGLKGRIRGAHEEGICQLREGYASPEQLGEWVLDDFTKLIDRLYPKDQTPAPLDLEASQHEAYARSRRLAFVGREELLGRLNEQISGPGTPLLLIGESGCGKSALLAEWVARWRNEHPYDLVIQHYIGSTPESADWQRLIHRILNELKRVFSITDNIPVHPDALRTALEDWSLKATGSRRVVLVMDALNQLTDQGTGRQLGWLPVVLPTNFRVIVSTLPGEGLDAVRKRGWPELNVPLLARADIARAAIAYFEIVSKTPPPDLLAKLDSTPATCNALYLRAVLDELRQFGKHEELQARAAEYLSSADLPGLFDCIITRWEQDFGDDLVRRALQHLWAGRQGLSESEWLNLLGTNGRALPRQMFTPMFLAIEPYLALRGGLYFFGHDFLRQAVQAKYLSNADDRRAVHLTLADYFEEQKEMSPRKAAEWPWQLRASESWTRLEAALTDFDLFGALNDEVRKWELAGYWQPLRQQGCDMEACYAKAYKRQPSDDAHLAYSLGAFLIANGCYRTGKSLMEKAAASSKASSLGEFDANYSTSQASLAFLLEAQGDFPGAAAIREQVLTIYELSFGERDRFTATACVNLAGTYLHMGRWDEAAGLLRRALKIDEHEYGKDHPEVATDLISLAECLRSGNKLSDAEVVLKRALSICKNHLPPKHPLLATILSNLATLLSQSSRPKEALPLAVEAVEIDRGCFGEDSPKLATHLNNLAGVMKANGRVGDALKPAQEALEILVKNSVLTGVPHRETEAAAISLASLAIEAGLPEPLILHVVNNILRPMRDIGKAPESWNVSSSSNSVFNTNSGRENFPRMVHSLDNAQATDGQDCDTEIAKSKNDLSVEINEMDRVSQLLVRLDPRNVQYRAERGDPGAQCYLAVILQDRGDMEQAVVWYRRAAENGVAQAQFNLGVLLVNGVGVEEDMVEAVRWYEEAAKQGYLNAIYNLAFMRENGYGCPKDLRAALQLYESAANQNEPDSQCKLALLLLDDIMQERAGYLYRHEGWDFVPIDIERARRLLNETAEDGHKISVEILRRLGWG